MLRILLYAFIIYLLYRLIFDFIIPVYKTTRQVRKGFREMHDNMQNQMNQQDQQSSRTQPGTKKEQVGDYIDYEEL